MFYDPVVRVWFEREREREREREILTFSSLSVKPNEINMHYFVRNAENEVECKHCIHCINFKNVLHGNL